MSNVPLLKALDPRAGNSLSEKYGPLLVTVATIGVAVAACFGLVPELGVAGGLALLAGGGLGSYVRSQA